MELHHDHEMVSPAKVQFMQRPKEISPVVRQLIKMYSKSGVGTTQILSMLAEMTGRIENVGFTNQDNIRNVLRDIRHRVFDSGDAQAVLALLRELHKNTFGQFLFELV